MRNAALWISAGWLAASVAWAAPTERQLKLLQNNCLQCHARPGIGAPLAGRPEDWQSRNRLGEDAMLRNVVQGMRGMPPLGYCAACDEADLRVLIRLLAGLEARK
ncbi:cytochrome c5 family protein [Duganella sp. FT92W]|uniref:Cytochrome c5 family protein n=1 Tax=Pseudoduganella rivuli TaxID=2666085 RepID=A0A7X2IJ46_9BURK|nr:c-type cytochrome [Pseudoduganella rivuli]MRV70433.1 cytochrome c5 family protein [Pseudoduganella rivuli]